MTYMNGLCVDAGTDNCPCPLAETGDCLVCSRLAGRQECDCSWAGVCVYNEFVQNGKTVRQQRRNKPVDIIKKVWYDSDLLVIVLKVSRGFALKAAQPGSFVFVNAAGRSELSNVPVSVMRSDVENGRLFLALKVISAKTKAVAEAGAQLVLRGVYRNGLIGGGVSGVKEDLSGITQGNPEPRWLIMTKGTGFAPAVNLLSAAGGRIAADLLIDSEKVCDEIVADSMRDISSEKLSVRKVSLQELTAAAISERTKGRPGHLAGIYRADDYDRIIIMASDYYIKTLADCMEIPAGKLVFCNNFRMCCGEGICGACGHTDENGSVSKMCKCRSADVTGLL